MTDSEFIDFMKELILAPDSAIKKAHMERAVGIIAKKDEEIRGLVLIADDMRKTANESYAALKERESDLVRNCAKANAEKDRLEEWIDDLQSGMYINCVYCGHRYGPNPLLDQSHLRTMRKALEQHIKELEGAYTELIMSVETKIPDESRHETALRYIRERERRGDNITKAALKEKANE